MKSSILVLGCIFAAATAVAQDQSATAGAATVTPVSKGQMVMSANGARVGVVYRVSADGSPQIIIDGKMVTIPAATLSSSNGKLVTNLSKNAVSELR
jgi:hypothetical protein